METHRLALKPGYQIDHFRIEGVLGKGGFGITYVALDLQLGKKVAIKELLPDSIATRVDGSTVVPHSDSLKESWEWARERFLDEARVLAGFSHPAIVGVHRLIEANGTVYMVMDFVDGESYEARLRRIWREPDQASLMAVIEPILRGLQDVHRAGLIHRDIKTENILINRHGQPILIDFGSSRSAVGATMTMTSIVTHGYSPIEQYQTKGKMGPWTDIYALGAVMCRAITGEKPPVAADRLMDDDFIWLSNRGLAGFDETFLTAVDWALRVRPEERPKQIADWDIHLLSQSPPGRTKPEPVDADAGKEEKNEQCPVEPDIGARKIPPVETNQKKKDRTTFVVAVIGIAVLCVFFLAIMVSRAKETPGKAEVARIAQAAEAAQQKEVENTLGMKFVPVLGTDVLFSIWNTRVKDYAVFAEATGASVVLPSFSQTLNDPVVNVSWEDAQAFCKWLTEKERAAGKIGKNKEYRLPTDAEWSVAVGLPPESGNTPGEKDGKAKDVYPWGTQWPPPKGVGNYAPALGVDSYDNTSPVGSFPANRFRLYDMGGNVWQWCEDSHTKDGFPRVVRGAAWFNRGPEALSSSGRNRGLPESRSGGYGFRCVLGSSR